MSRGATVASEPGKASNRTTAGPWLRYGGGCGPGDNAWHASVLFVERVQGSPLPAPAAAAAAEVAAPGAPAAAAAAAQQVETAAAAQHAKTAVAAAAVLQEAATAAASQRAAAAAPAAPLAAAAAAAGPQAATEPLEPLEQQQQQQQPVLQLVDAGSTGEQQVTPALLDSVGGWAFWRFDLCLPLTAAQRAVTYCVRATAGSCTREFTFWLPAVEQPMHWGFQSCNGFSGSVPADAPERQDPTYLWRDLLQLHSAFPMHCLVGGGDQVYSDGVFKPELGGSPALYAWSNLRKHRSKLEAAWTAEMEEEATAFFLQNYIHTFAQPDVDEALACIPQLMMWDDHDIWDGWGSYTPDLQACPVFKGLFGVARRFYLLFQQHTTDAFNARAQEFLVNDGSSFHWLRYMGPQVALLGVDMRSERSKARILPPAAYGVLQAAVGALPARLQHLVVLSGVPLVFPALPTVERVLGCFASMALAMPRFLRLARTTGLMDRFDQPEIYDDLLDGWVATVHKAERLEFIRMLQRWAREQALRVTILSGDAHVAGVGRLYSRPKIRPIGDDSSYMVQIISSAIMNGPPPHGALKALVRLNWRGRVDENTMEKMTRAFYPQHPRVDKLRAARNWCDISLVAPPFSPPVHPSDPLFGGLRFVIRAETARDRRGHAEETYTTLVPRHPKAAKAAIGTGAPPAASSGGAGGGGGSSSSACPPPFYEPKLHLKARGL